jgi:DNA-binding NarL/FixJ family response regulator
MELNPSNAGELEIEFTRQEIRILKLASDGHLNKEIADHLKIAETTVKRYRQNCMKKIGIEGKQAMNRFLMNFKEWYATKVPQKWY